MPEPNVPGGLPLDPTIDQLKQPESNIVHPPISNNKRHKTTPSSNQRDRSRTTKSRRCSKATEQQSSGVHIGSSHPEQQSTTNPTTMSSHPPSVNYTRTGRISKAKKGLKVHNCGNCGKVSYIVSVPSTHHRLRLSATLCSYMTSLHKSLLASSAIRICTLA
jgi:hypothetical protein